MKKLYSKSILINAAIILAMLWVVLNYKVALSGLSLIISLVMPFILGLCFAFILSVPMGIVEKNIFTRLELRSKEGGRGRRILSKGKRVFSLLLTYIVLAAIMAVIIVSIVPEIKHTIEMLISQVPTQTNDLRVWLTSVSKYIGFDVNFIDFAMQNKQELGKKLLYIISVGDSGIAGAAVSITMRVFSGVAYAAIGFVFSIYILIMKEQLAGQVRALTVAFFSGKTAKKLFRISKLATHVFTGFVKGQFLEGLIITTFVTIGTLFISPSYAVMLGILLGVCALVPVVGSILGTIIGAIILLGDDPWHALAFIIFIIVMQQIESNLIYPKVVGSNISLPGIWVLLAVVAGGALAGLTGVILFVPLAAFVYAVVGDSVRTRLHEKEVTAASIDEMVADSEESINKIIKS
ncbi:MAG: AI-2E family transporter [Clostridiales Family XIII bacterium]|jgi:predicted PurR-regulated permease PerM|nr:AI-2E family transporter [Clostridiales Family XIII bacterium]